VLKINVPFEDRPRCWQRGCNNPAAHTGNYRVDGTPMFRKDCREHHDNAIAKKHGLKSVRHVIAKNAGFETVAKYTKSLQQVVAKNAGFETYTQYKNSKHPYLRYRKTYCENIDSRLGFVCTTTILLAAQLEVDHIDGNHLNNNLENLQTLCGCCHKYKTIVNEDWKTPGRKTRNSLSKDSDSPD